MPNAKFMIERFLVSADDDLHSFLSRWGTYYCGHITGVTEIDISFVADTFADDHAAQVKRSNKKKGRPVRYRNEISGAPEAIRIHMDSIDFTSLAFYTPILDQ